VTAQGVVATRSAQRPSPGSAISDEPSWAAPERGVGQPAAARRHRAGSGRASTGRDATGGWQAARTYHRVARAVVDGAHLGTSVSWTTSASPRRPWTPFREGRDRARRSSGRADCCPRARFERRL